MPSFAAAPLTHRCTRPARSNDTGTSPLDTGPADHGATPLGKEPAGLGSKPPAKLFHVTVAGSHPTSAACALTVPMPWVHIGSTLTVADVTCDALGMALTSNRSSV